MWGGRDSKDWEKIFLNLWRRETGKGALTWQKLVTLLNEIFT